MRRTSPERRLSAATLLFQVALIALPGLAQDTKPASLPVISLSEAIQRAQQTELNFVRARAAQQSAAADRYIARASLLPSVTYHNQALYTEPNGQTNQAGSVGTQPSPIFIANNAVREYASQASVNEILGFKRFADAQVASANAARAAAELEVSRRGLVATVVSLYYTVSTSETKKNLLAQAFREAQSFTELTQKREAAREVAHADAIKAELQQQQRQRDLSDGILAAEKARLELAVLLFPDPRTPYLTEAPQSPSPLLSREQVDKLASDNNPEIRSALAELKAGNAELRAARAAYLPDLALNFTYGIDAPQFARRGPENVRNLGYSMSATLDIPVWDWFSTQKRVKQSAIQRDVAKAALTVAQRRLIAALEEAYAEAAAARDQAELLDLSVRTSAESLRLTKLRYSAGEATALEVVDAQTAYLSSQTARADNAVRYQAALAGLQILTGKW